MKARFLTIFSVAVGVTALSSGVAAHHGAAVVYDLNQTLHMTGTVTDFQFVNPHVLIFFEVTGEDGNPVVWSAGLTSPNRLARSDRWTINTVKVGDEVTVSGSPARSGAPSLWAEQVVANGKALLGENE